MDVVIVGFIQKDDSNVNEDCNPGVIRENIIEAM
jgi:hypothetical protein